MNQPCCRALTAECLACSMGVSVKDFCSKPENKDVVGCENIESRYVLIQPGTKLSNINKGKKRIINRYY